MTRHLVDPGWTKEETDYLFALVKDYSTRWYVVHDRYEFLGGPTRVLDVSLSLSQHAVNNIDLLVA